MLSYLRYFYWNILWNEWFWIGNTLTWEKVAPENNPHIKMSSTKEIFYFIPSCIAYLVIRYILQKHLYLSLGEKLNIPNRKPKYKPNPQLEYEYQIHFKKNKKRIAQIAEKYNIPVNEITTWWCKRIANDRPSRREAFSEHLFHFTHYFLVTTYGLIVLWDKSWFWNYYETVEELPYHSIDNTVWWYVFLSNTYYITISITQLYYGKRRDFIEMFIHHYTTIMIQYLAFIANLHRCFALMLYLHDICDVFGEAARAFQAGRYRIPFVMSAVVFTVVWVVNRLMFIPYFIYVAYDFKPKYHDKPPSTVVVFILLLILQSLHIYWTWCIGKSYWRALKSNTAIYYDDSESNDSSDETSYPRKIDEKKKM